MSYPWFQPPVKPKIFLSYHHNGDRWYYDAFSRLFCDSYDVARDNSVDRIIDSDNADYVIRNIREDYITGTSCTIVLCGAETPGRKFVDWEIKATLDREHGLIGINLPSNRAYADGTWPVPDRFLDNYRSGYAVWTAWNHLVAAPASLAGLINQARSSEKWKIDNSRVLRTRNS